MSLAMRTGPMVGSRLRAKVASRGDMVETSNFKIQNSKLRFQILTRGDFSISEFQLLSLDFHSGFGPEPADDDAVLDEGFGLDGFDAEDGFGFV